MKITRPACKNPQYSGGFTLIELLVVVAIIGLLASIVLIPLNSARKKAKNTRTQTSVGQIRAQLEAGFANGVYGDLVGSGTNRDSLASGTAGEANITTSACDIGSQNDFASAGSGELVLTCSGVANKTTGVVIYSTSVTSAVSNYAIYATTTPGGYICVDSYGNSAIKPLGSMPSYAAITSPTTKLCQ